MYLRGPVFKEDKSGWRGSFFASSRHSMCCFAGKNFIATIVWILSLLQSWPRAEISYCFLSASIITKFQMLQGFSSNYLKNSSSDNHQAFITSLAWKHSPQRARSQRDNKGLGDGQRGLKLWILPVLHTRIPLYVVHHCTQGLGWCPQLPVSLPNYWDYFYVLAWWSCAGPVFCIGWLFCSLLVVVSLSCYSST